MAGYGNRKRRGRVGKRRMNRKKRIAKKMRKIVKRVQKGVISRRIGRRL